MKPVYWVILLTVVAVILWPKTKAQVTGGDASRPYVPGEWTGGIIPPLGEIG